MPTGSRSTSAAVIALPHDEGEIPEAPAQMRLSLAAPPRIITQRGTAGSAFPLEGIVNTTLLRPGASARTTRSGGQAHGAIARAAAEVRGQNDDVARVPVSFGYSLPTARESRARGGHMPMASTAPGIEARSWNEPGPPRRSLRRRDRPDDCSWSATLWGARGSRAATAGRP